MAEEQHNGNVNHPKKGDRLAVDPIISADRLSDFLQKLGKNHP